MYICMQSWGGDVEFIYKHEEYWPALLGITNDLREQHMARWEKLGGRIGLSEWDVKEAFEDAVANGNEEATDISTPAEVKGEPETEV
jgi:phosphatidylinositol/phosphatidylcholine transfer protein